MVVIYFVYVQTEHLTTVVKVVADASVETESVGYAEDEPGVDEPEVSIFLFKNST